MFSVVKLKFIAKIEYSILPSRLSNLPTNIYFLYYCIFRAPLGVERVLKWDIACQQGVAIVTVTLV